MPSHNDLIEEHRDSSALNLASCKGRVARGAGVSVVRDCGLRIPDDVSAVGCNDSYGTILYPPLTTLRSFPMQLARAWSIWY
jgi:DNA-binding LacI/PurR family transcriptional regulator